MNASIAKTALATKQAMLAAWNLFRQGFIHDAELIAHECYQQNTKSSDVLHLLGTLALQQGKTKEAVQYLSQAVASHKSNQKLNPEILNNLGLAYHEQGLLPLAIKQYQRALALAPQYADAYYNLHAALLDAKNLTPSIQNLKKVLAINPRDADAVFMLGMLLDYQGNVSQAESYLAQVQRLGGVYAARVDAWQYLKSAIQQQSNFISQIPVMGNGLNIFQHAMERSKVDGLVLEFGVRFGKSIHMLSELANQAVHGFDSFEGLPDEWHHEPKGSYTTKGVVPQVPESVTLHVGWFDDTLPKFLAEHAGAVRFINIDCDIYSSTKTVLTLLAPRVVAGTVIVFDEYIGNQHWREDEYKAFQEAVATFGWKYEYISFSFFTKQVAVIITQVG